MSANPSETQTPEARGKPKMSALATWSCGLAFSSFLCLFFTSLPAVLLGHLAKERIRKSNGALTGTGRANAGLVMGYLGLLGLVVLISSSSGTRSTKLQQAIHPGMSAMEVENLLITERSSGRLLVNYEMMKDGKWESSTAQAIAGLASEKSTNNPAGRIHLTSFGILPVRHSFDIEFDGSGKVVKTTIPYGWE